MKNLIILSLSFALLSPAFANKVPMTLEQEIIYQEKQIKRHMEQLSKYQAELKDDIKVYKGLQSSIEKKKAALLEEKNEDKKLAIQKMIRRHEIDSEALQKSIKKYMERVEAYTKSIKSQKARYESLKNKSDEKGEKSIEQKSKKS